MLQILEHGGLDVPVLLHGDGDQHGGDGALDGVRVVEQGGDVLALDGGELHAGGVAHIDALLHTTNGHLPGGGVLGHAAKGAAHHGAEAGECGVDQQLGPPGTQQVGLLVNGAHQLQQALDHIKLGVADAFHLAHVEGQAVGIAGQDALARTSQGRTPFHGTAHGVAAAHDLGNARLGQAVLQGHDDAILGKEVLQHGHYLLVLQLLGHQQDDIVLALHLIRGDGFHGDGHLHGARDMGALLVQHLNMRGSRTNFLSLVLSCKKMYQLVRSQTKGFCVLLCCGSHLVQVGFDIEIQGGGGISVSQNLLNAFDVRPATEEQAGTGVS